MFAPLIVAGIALAAGGRPQVNGWLVFYDDGGSLADFQAHANQLDVVSADYFGCKKDGTLILKPEPTVAQKQAVWQTAQKNHVLLLGLVSNAVEGDFSADGVEAHLGSPTAMKAHADALVKLATDAKLGGLDLDYESLHAQDRDAFSDFVDILADDCHAHRLKLAIAVASKEKEPGEWEGAVSEDYSRLGKKVDFFRVMAYDESQQAGPVGSIGLATRVMKFTTSVVAPSKIDLGVPGYGYDWDGAKNSDVDWTQFSALAAAHKDGLSRDPNSGELVLKFDNHTVSFSDGACELRKYKLAQQMKLHGIALWRLGTEDPQTWTLLPKRS